MKKNEAVKPEANSPGAKTDLRYNQALQFFEAACSQPPSSQQLKKKASLREVIFALHNDN